MKMTTIEEQEELLDFIAEATAHFDFYPEYRTYTKGEILPECLFAVRWGLGDDCILVFKLGDMEPTIYQNCINTQTHVLSPYLPVTPAPLNSFSQDDDILF